MRLLAVLRVKRAGSESSTRLNIASRIVSMPRFAAHASPYCARKPASPRIANRPMIATGTSHSERWRSAKPRSSKSFNSAGIAGSVSAPTSEPTMASTKPGRLVRKNGAMRARRAFSGNTGEVMGRDYRAARREARRPLALPTIACPRTMLMRPITLSVILITRNEAHNVAGCLGSVAFADEWIVVDSASTDATREIAEQFGARVVTTSDWPGFGAQKNRALALAQGRWVLSIDADERVSDELAASIRRVLAADTSGHEAHAFSQVAPAQPLGYELSRLSSF